MQMMWALLLLLPGNSDAICERAVNTAEAEQSQIKGAALKQ